MNTLRKMRKNAKALSPVVASIILIAVTVAVSIAVAAWMGALVVGNMNTEELKITNVEFDMTTGATVATLTVKNTGSSDVTVADVYVGSASIAGATLTPSATIKPGVPTTVDVPFTSYQAGQAYQFKLVSTKGNAFVYTATAPL